MHEVETKLEVQKMRKKHSPLVFSVFFIFIFSTGRSAIAENNTIPVNVGVVLDMDTWLGKMGLSCISMAVPDFYASHSHYKTRLLLHTRDSQRDVVGAAAAALDLLKNVKAEAILGPSSSMQARFMIDLGDKAQVPVISFSATSPSLSPIRSPYFIRATQNDSSQVKAISAIVKAFGWREVVLIYQDNEFGEGIVPFLTDALQGVDARVPYRSILSPTATDDQLLAELYKLMTMQTRVFIVHMWSTLGSRLFTKAKEVGMMDEGYVWILTDSLTNILSSMDTSVIDSMQGVLGITPHVPHTKKLDEYTFRWKRKFQQDNPDVLDAELDVFGLWAYDAATMLAIAAEEVGVTDFEFRKSTVSRNLTDLETFGVSTTGPMLLQALLKTTFKGLSGDFHIVDGQIQSSIYQIVNVLGKGGRRIGYWTADNGIVRKLNPQNKNTYSTSKSNLGAIIWPGDTTSPPKGWVIPTNGKKLRVGVPKKDGFSEFVKVTLENSTNTTRVTGYCIAVFEAVIAALPYAVPYEFVPFETPDGKPAGSYDELVHQLYLENYDVVVGDTTIVANRSRYVDFTLPFTESGVSLIVPLKDNRRKTAWVFLKPLTWKLWLLTFCSFVFIGFVIWVLEHRINEDFRGPRLHQVGMIFWFSFSTMVFAHKEKVVSNLTKFVVIIWVFVVLILTQSYTASLTSMLTVEQLQPTVKNVDELKGEYVGYQKGSFVLGLLKLRGFDESKLRVYNSPEELNALFFKGSRNGGIAAAFDEIPYMQVFLARYCSKYAMVDPTYKTDGFGFAFPIGSPLVPDVSRAVLNVTEGDEMVRIEKAWFVKQTSCSESVPSVTSNSLDLESFWGLFLIAGIASFSALIIFVVMFLHEHWPCWMCFPATLSLWKKIKLLALHYDRKDLSSHTFRERGDLGSHTPRERKSNARSSENCDICRQQLPPISRHPTPESSGPSSISQTGAPSQEHDGSTPDGQTTSGIVPTIELASQNQEKAGPSGTKSETD